MVSDGSASETVSTGIDGLSQRGRSVRKNAAGLQFSISSVKTKENPGYQTTRRNIRLERTVTGLSNDANPKGKIVAQITISKPDDEPTITPDMVRILLAELVNFLVYGDEASTTDKTVVEADFTDVLARILADEG